MDGAFHAALSPTAFWSSKTKRYGVDNSHLGAFKATRQSTQIPQSPGYSRAFADAIERNGLKCGRDDTKDAPLPTRVIIYSIWKKNNS